MKRELKNRPGYALGAIFNPGGKKNSEIKFCRFLVFEDDGPGGLEEKKDQWVTAGLPQPSFQVWTGGKSVHHYYLLEKPCSAAEYKRAMKRLAAHCKRSLGAGVDNSLSNAARILRMAGGIHPKTGEMARCISSGGKKYSLEQLWNLTGDDPYVEVSEATRNAVASFYEPAPRTPLPQGQDVPDGELRELPDMDTPEFKTFAKQQVLNDEKHKPTAAGFFSFPRPKQIELTAEALRFCVDRGPKGTGTYPTAFSTLAAVVNTFGVNDALDVCFKAGWGQSHWDIVDQAKTIEENSLDRDQTQRYSIFRVFDQAEYNGWVRPWRITKDAKTKTLNPEELAQERAIKRIHIQQWMESRASQLTLADVFHADIAEILRMRAKAFPVSETAMLPPFIAAMASVMGTRYKVQIKKGWTEPMVFWFGSVGPASSLKTPVANQVFHPLLSMDSADQRQYKQDLKEYKAGGKEGNAPDLPRKRVASDLTLEGLSAALENEKNVGMLCHHDELVGFIASMDAYRNGKGGKDRAQWLSMWSGQEINILRASKDPVFIERTAVSIFGSVQQDKLTELLHGDDATAKSGDGFWARFLWCVPCNPRPKMNRDETEINVELLEMAHAFDSLMKQPTIVELNDEAWELMAEQCDAWVEEIDRTYAARAAFLGKMRGYTARFAGFLHALDYVNRLRGPNGSGALFQIDKKISADTMRRALLLSQFFINQFDVLAPQVGGNEELPSWVVKIIELADSRPDKKVTVKCLRERKWGADMQERKGMLEAMANEYGIGRMLNAPRANQVWWTLE